MLLYYNQWESSRWPKSPLRAGCSLLWQGNDRETENQKGDGRIWRKNEWNKQREAERNWFVCGPWSCFHPLKVCLKAAREMALSRQKRGVFIHCGIFFSECGVKLKISETTESQFPQLSTGRFQYMAQLPGLHPLFGKTSRNVDIQSVAQFRNWSHVL